MNGGQLPTNQSIGAHELHTMTHECVCVSVYVYMCVSMYMRACMCMSTTSLHFIGAVVWFMQTVTLFEKAQYIMIGNRLVRKITCKQHNCSNRITRTCNEYQF